MYIKKIKGKGIYANSMYIAKWNERISTLRFSDVYGIYKSPSLKNLRKQAEIIMRMIDSRGGYGRILDYDVDTFSYGYLRLTNKGYTLTVYMQCDDVYEIPIEIEWE